MPPPLLLCISEFLSLTSKARFFSLIFNVLLRLNQSHPDSHSFLKPPLPDNISNQGNEIHHIHGPGIIQGVYTRDMDLGGPLRVLPILGIIITLTLQDYRET